jgi:hypothetical protein
MDRRLLYRAQVSCNGKYMSHSEEAGSDTISIDWPDASFSLKTARRRLSR